MRGSLGRDYISIRRVAGLAQKPLHRFGVFIKLRYPRRHLLRLAAV